MLQFRPEREVHSPGEAADDQKWERGVAGLREDLHEVCREPEIDMIELLIFQPKFSSFLCSCHTHPATQNNSSIDLPFGWLPLDFRIKPKLLSMAI